MHTALAWLRNYFLPAAQIGLFWLTFSISISTAGTLHIMSYHDVRIKQSELSDDLGVTVAQLASHFAWFKHEGYKVVSVDDVLAAQRAERALPEKAVLLTFDDGLASVYDSVLPLLQVFNYPAVVAVVGSWLTDESKFPLRYGRVDVRRNFFLTPEQLRALATSPLIEFASHSYDLHRGIIANEAGQTQPAAVVRVWDSRLKLRENSSEYARRIRDDVARNVSVIEQLTGKKPRVMVWPFGEYTGAGAAIAREIGMPIGMTLTEGRNAIPGPLTSLKRNLVSARTDLNRLAVMLGERDHVPVRFVEASLAEIAPLPAAQKEVFLDKLLDRVVVLGATHVIIPAYADALALFESGYEPSADVMNRIAWQFRTRLGVRVFARWPAARSDATSALGLQHLAAFSALQETVALAGVVLDFGAAPITPARYSALAKIVRDAHPDDELMVAGDSAHLRTLAELNLGLAPELWANGILIHAKNANTAPQVFTAQTDAALSPKAKNTVWIEFDGATDATQLAQSMRGLQKNGWLNFGWANDSFERDAPAAQIVVPAFSRRAELR
jgi:peptidoglycan/xylan/chitin deacetylase (PgdA/CDA1 family)